MSSQALSWATTQVVRPATAKLLLLVLADHANAKSGDIFPSIARLEAFTSLNRKTVISAMKRLIELGIVQMTDRRVGERGQIKVYRLNRDWGGPDVTAASAQRVPKTDVKSTDFGTVEESRKRDTEPTRVLEPRSMEPRSYHDGEDLFGLIETTKMSDDEIADAYVERWNALADRVPKLTPIRQFTEKRQAAIVARIDSYETARARVPGEPHARSRDAVLALIDRVLKTIEGSRFLRGDKTDFKAHADFPLTPAQFTKLEEIGYAQDYSPDPFSGAPKPRNVIEAGRAALDLLLSRPGQSSSTPFT